MGLRVALVALIALGTAGFVVGTTLERNSGESKHKSAATLKAEGRSAPSHAETKTPSGEGGERPAARAAESGASGATTKAASSTPRAELKPLGVNIEAVPFVVLAAVVSLALGLAAYSRPRATLLLIGVAATMLIFALLGLREVSHQSDENRSGLAVLAADIAFAHFAAAVVAAVMARQASRPVSGPAGSAATMAG